MPLSLPRLQSRTPVTEGNGLPGRAFHQWWDRFAKSIEDAFNGLSVAVEDISAAQSAITALEALETVGEHEAKADPHPQYLTAAEGSGAYAPLSHVGAGGTAHSDATTLAAGFMSAADKTKLDGVAAGATANATDAALRDRSTHTGTQSVSTLTGVLPVANGGTGAASLTAGYLVKGNGTSAVTAAVVYDDGTNIGVGNPSPGAKLDVAGNIRLSAANPNIELNNGGPQVYSTSANTLQFATGGGVGTPLERFRVGPSGQFGIGGANYGTSGQVLTSQGGSSAPTWTTPTTGTVTSVSGTGTVNGITLTGTVNSSGSLTLGGTLSGVSLTTQVTGTLPVGNGGTGATTLTGYVKGNGTSAMTASATVPASDVTGLAAVATSGSFADLSNKPGIQSNGQDVITGNKTFGTSDKGKNFLVLNSGLTITFPASGYASGEGVVISNVSGGSVTLSCPGGSDFGATLPNNGSFFAFCDGGGYWRQYCYSTSRL